MSRQTRDIRYLFAVLLFFFFSAAVQAQKISGNVKDPSGEPIIGATVKEQGTKNGVVTDMNGNFTIQLKGIHSPGSRLSRLIISYVGMQNKTVDVTGKSFISVTMKDDAQMLDEVVSIGYGTVRKKDLTGAVAQVTAKQIEDIPVTDVTQALQGKMSGVNITVADGAPDAESSIRVRGGGSISQSNEPLYIVDGFEVSSISDIAPSEIETIDVLKDASSTAIYGAKGANGVVFITTKSTGGKDGDRWCPKVNFNASWKWSKAKKFQKMLSPYEFARLKYEANSSELGTDPNARTSSVGGYSDLDIYKSVAGTDYQDEIFGRTGFQQMYNVNIAGGTKKFGYNVTYAHDDQDAIMLGSGSSKNNISAKIKSKFNKYLALDVQARLSFNKVKGLSSGSDATDSGKSSSIVANSVSWSPIEGIDLDPDDEEVQNTTSYTPLQRLNSTRKVTTTNKQTYNAGLTWTPWKHWTFKTEFSYSHSKQTVDQVWAKEATSNSPYGYSGKPQSRLYYVNQNMLQSKNYVTYENKKLFGGRDNINVVFGFDISSSRSNNSEDFRAAYPVNSSIDDVLNNREVSCIYLPLIYNDNPDDNMESFYARARYGIKDGRYMFNFVVRADGSSRFSSGNQWGFFPSGAFAWRISDESWMKRSSHWLSNLKMRISFGLSGNNKVNHGYSFKTYAYTNNKSKNPYFTNDEVSVSLARANSSLYNPHLKWETTIDRDFGIDYGFWNGRINGSFDVYWKTTKDLLMRVSIPGNSGSTTQYQNFGKTSNKGAELSLNVVAFDSRKFTINATMNIAYNKNKIEELSQYAGQWQSSSFAGSAISNYEDFKTVTGGAIGEIWGYETDGFYTPVVVDASGTYVSGEITYNKSAGKWELDPNYSSNESYSSVGGTLYPGMLKLKDQDGDGQITEKDKVRLGNTIPQWTGGFGGDVTWRNPWGSIDASVFFNYSIGNKVLNGTKLANSFDRSAGKLRYNVISDFSPGNYYTWIDPETGYNLGRPNTEVYNYYGGSQGLQNRLAQINAGATLYNPVATTKMLIINDAVEDGSFLRLQTVTIGYSFPKKLVKKLSLSNLRIYFTGYNLACITGYSGSDPEVNRSGSTMCPGVDYATYPKTRSFVGGINISF